MNEQDCRSSSEAVYSVPSAQNRMNEGKTARGIKKMHLGNDPRANLQGVFRTFDPRGQELAVAMRKLLRFYRRNRSYVKLMRVSWTEQTARTLVCDRIVGGRSW